MIMVKISDDIILKKAGSATLGIEFVGSDIAYYTVYVKEYSGQEILYKSWMIVEMLWMKS